MAMALVSNVATATATGTVKSGACWITGIVVTGPAANDGTVTVYDGTSTSGSVVGEYYMDAKTMVVDPIAKRCENGIHVAFSGTTDPKRIVVHFA